MKTLLKGGKVISGSGAFSADVMIENEKITQVAKELDGAGADVLDVSGMLLFPGFIDAHTHFDLHVAGTVTADDFESGTRSAVCGGTTTVIDFATAYKGETLCRGFDNWMAKAKGKSFCDYGFHMSITDWNDSIRRELSSMTERGITSYKLYMTYDTMMVGDGAIYEILKALGSEGAFAGIHCEHAESIDSMRREFAEAGRLGVSSHPETRPAACEAEAVHRLLFLAKLAKAPVMIVHLTCEEALLEVEAARVHGQTVFAETCPQYLLLDDSVYYEDGFGGARYVIAPPLRKKSDCKALWGAISRRAIQTVCTDHCSFTQKQKELGLHDFRSIPGGMPGVETRGILMFSEGVQKGRITLSDMCRVLCENPARLYGLSERKGYIREGADADIVIIDPAAEGKISAATHHSACDYSPFEGLVTQGLIRRVLLRGAAVSENGQPCGDPNGEYLSRSRADFSVV